ncbi:hypothetical protein ACFVFF_37215 [Streptomyces sp. NPDC057680]|uniref:hypothetical protein n=1 Tax=Streptomyces sp. NPDC057680 TaxID=3346208 RepID=UPI0036744E63
MIDDTEHNGYSKHLTRLDIINQPLWPEELPSTEGPTPTVLCSRAGLPRFTSAHAAAVLSPARTHAFPPSATRAAGFAANFQPSETSWMDSGASMA